MENEFAVIDFETTGLGADCCRIIEVGAVVVRDGQVTESFTRLMNPGCRLPYFITELTGITDAMLRGKPRPEHVMPELLQFLDGRVCVAHNAGFDSRFFHAEMERAGLRHERPFFCTMMLARRLIQDAPNHQLGTLARHLELPRPDAGSYHRALYDAMLAAELWKHLEDVLSKRLGGGRPKAEIYQAVMKKSKKTVWQYLDKVAQKG